MGVRRLQEELSYRIFYFFIHTEFFIFLFYFFFIHTLQPNDHRVSIFRAQTNSIHIIPPLFDLATRKRPRITHLMYSGFETVGAVA